MVRLNGTVALVNNVWGGYEHFFDVSVFWKEKGVWAVPLSRWDVMRDPTASRHATATGAHPAVCSPRRYS